MDIKTLKAIRLLIDAMIVDAENEQVETATAKVEVELR